MEKGPREIRRFALSRLESDAVRTKSYFPRSFVAAIALEMPCFPKSMDRFGLSLYPIRPFPLCSMHYRANYKPPGPCSSQEGSLYLNRNSNSNAVAPPSDPFIRRSNSS